jgi:hypothetical protein
VTRSALALYHRAPDALRRVVQRRSYARLDRHLRGLGARASTYPVDTTGWLLVELLKALVRRAGGELVRLARWPAPFDSAAMLTHDIEPCIYAYTADSSSSRPAWRAADTRPPSVWPWVRQPVAARALEAPGVRRSRPRARASADLEGLQIDIAAGT